jgi:hypothetical protein
MSCARRVLLGKGLGGCGCWAREPKTRFRKEQNRIVTCKESVLAQTTARSYRAEFDQLRGLWGGLAPATEALAAVKAQQLEAFEAWAAAQGIPGGGNGASGGAGQIQAFHGAAAVAAAAGSDEEDFEELDPAETFERLQMAK